MFDGLLERFAAEGDELFVASTYGNRGLTRLDRGDAAAARADLEAARAGFAACGATFKVATMDHNLGRVAGRRGDLVQALDRFAAAERQLVELGEDTAEIQANRVEVLLESGLFDEAARVAAATERAMGSAGLELDRAEIALARSLALLGADDLRGATEHAHRAAGLFAAQQRSGWAEEATVVARRAEARLGSAVDVAELADVARALAAGGRRLAALQAWSVVATRDPRLAAAEAAWCRSSRLRSSRSSCAWCRRRSRRASRPPSATCPVPWARPVPRSRSANRHRLAVDAADVRAGIGAHLAAIAQLGLGVRREHGRVWDVVRWVDATRGGSLDVVARPVPGDAAIEEILSRLRAVQVASRDAAPDEAFALLRERARLQRRLAAAQRSARGGRRRQRALPRRLADVFDDRRVVQYHRHGDRLGAVVIDGGTTTMVDLAPLAAIDQAAATLRAALLRLIAGGGVALVQRRAAELAELVVAGLGLSAEPRPTVVVPLPQHLGLPWSLLAPFDGAPVTVAPTLRQWVTARVVAEHGAGSVACRARRGRRRADLRRRAAPDHRERGRRGRRRRSGRRPPASARRSTRSPRSDIVHVAAHGVRTAGDGRFAQLVLGDGDLTAFDLERLPAAAALVVLSACEAGLVDTLPGEESIGLATALFDRGCDTIVAGTLPLPDAAPTADVFGRIHELLAARVAPAEALFTAQAELGATAEGLVARSVSCFGRG